MRLGYFEVNIRGRHERQGGYIVLDHAETYTLEMINHSIDRRAEATVKIDGKEVGTWRLVGDNGIRPLQSIHNKSPLSNPIPVPVHSYGFFNR